MPPAHYPLDELLKRSASSQATVFICLPASVANTPCLSNNCKFSFTADSKPFNVERSTPHNPESDSILLTKLSILPIAHLAEKVDAASSCITYLLPFRSPYGCPPESFL